MIILIILFSLFFAVLAIYNLQLAISLLIVLLPAYLIRFQFGPLPSTLLEVMIWLVFLVWFIANFSELSPRSGIPFAGKTNVRESFKRLARKSTDGRIKIDYPFGREIILLLIVSFIAAGVAGFTNSALGIWKAYFFEPILLYIVVLNVFNPNVIPAKAGIQKDVLDEEQILDPRLRGDDKKENGFMPPKLLWPLCLSALAVSLLAIYQKITGNLIDNPFWAAVGTRRVVSFFGYPNAVGLYLGPLVLLFIGWLSYAKFVCRAPKKLQLLIALSITLSLIAIIFAKSAGVILGVAAGLAVFCLLASRRTRIAAIAVIALAVIGCATVPLARHQVWDKLTLRDFSGTVRRIGWNDSWKMLSDGRLIFGAGLANFQQAVKPYHQPGFYVSDGTSDFWGRLKTDAALRARSWQPLEIYLYPHNIFLNFWSELGLAGMLLFVWLIGKYFFIGLKLINVIPAKAGIQKDALDSGKILDPRLRGDDNKKVSGDDNKKFLVLGLISAMVVIVVHGLVDVPYFKNDLAVLFWLMVAMIGIINNYQTKNNL